MLLIYGVLLIFAAGAWWGSGSLVSQYEFRINNLDALPGVGSIQRSPGGDVYHVLVDGSARAVYPELGPPSYFNQCIDCRVLRENQISATDDYCAVGSRDALPAIDFETPCATSVTIDNGRSAIALGLFAIPAVLLGIVAGIRKGSFKPRAIEPVSPQSKFER